MKINLLLIFIVLSACSLLYSVPNDWDIYYGPKIGIGFGGSLTDVSLSDLSTPTFGATQTGQNKKGLVIVQGGFAANFITPNNFGFEIETGYRLGGETIPDTATNQYRLRMHYIDLMVIGKYWFFGKLISAGLGVVGSVLLNSTLKGSGISENITANLKRFDLSLIFRMSFNHWAVSKSLLVSLEISVLTGFIQQIKSPISGRLFNVGVYASIGVFYLKQTKGINLRSFRY